MKDKLYYLASPYTHENPVIKKERAEVATKAAVDLLHLGVFTFAPIPYNAPWEKYGLPGHWDFWERFDRVFISRCDALIVLKIDGWDVSKGVTAEIKIAKEQGIPIYYVTLEEIASKDIGHITGEKPADKVPFQVFFDGKVLDLTKRNKTLAKEIGIDDPDEIQELRELVKKQNVYTTIDPYIQDIGGENTLMWDDSEELLEEKAYQAAMDI